MMASVDSCPDSLLYKCVAHFLGRKAPGSSADSVESVQKPLSEIYSFGSYRCLAKDVARDVHLLVFNSGLYAIPVNPIDPRIWIPMQNFRSCAAVKGVTTMHDSENSENFCLTFKSLDSPDAASSSFPAIFTVTSARGNCVPLLDCYIFSCPSDAVALSLVEKSKQAFCNKRGWSMKPPSVTMSDILDNFSNTKWSCHEEEEKMPESREFINPELYHKPPLGGFYYAPKSGVIRTFDIGVEAEAYPLPDVEMEPQHCEPSSQYIIINQQANNVDQFQPAPIQSADFPGKPATGSLQLLDLYSFPERVIMPPSYADVTVAGDPRDAMAAVYPVLDPSNVPVTATYPFPLIHASGYYPELVINQPAGAMQK